MTRDEQLLLEAFQLLYQVYKAEKSGRRYFRPTSIYPVLAKIQKRLDKPVKKDSVQAAMEMALSQ